MLYSARMNESLVSPHRFAIAAFDAMPFHVAILDARGVILAVNKPWDRFAEDNGGVPGASVGQNYLRICEVTEGEDVQTAQEIALGIRQVLGGLDEHAEVEYPCETSRGLRHFLARVTSFHQDGVLYGLVTHEDITRRKLAELDLTQLNQTLEGRVAERTQLLEIRNRQLEASNQELSQFADVAAHDLQEPLRLIGAYTDLLSHRYSAQLDERGHKYVGHILGQVERARQLVRDVLTLSAVSTQPQMASVNLGELFAQQASQLDWPAGSVVQAAALPLVQGDAGQCAQLLINLMGNAIKFRSERPLVVTLEAEAPAPDSEGCISPWITLHFRDNGVGIAPQHRSQVFDMFRRLHSRSETGGNGIGLTVCRKVVERHGGRIWISDTPGGGATFSFTLPLL